MSAKSIHRHGCRTCCRSFEDACETPSDNEKRCFQCRTGRPGLYNILRTWEPRECCYTECRAPKKHKQLKIDEAASYNLAPGIPWWICGKCKQTFPYSRPRKETA